MHFSSGINILVQVVINGTAVVGNQENSLEGFFVYFQEVFCDFFLLLLPLVLKMHPFTKHLGSCTKWMYNPLQWARIQVEVQLAGHLRTQ